MYDLGNGQWDIPALRTLLDEVLARNKTVHDFEVEHTFQTVGRRGSGSPQTEPRKLDRVQG